MKLKVTMKTILHDFDAPVFVAGEGENRKSAWQEHLDKLKDLLVRCLQQYKSETEDFSAIETWHLIRPELIDDASPFTGFLTANELSDTEIIMLLVAMTPHVHPALFDDAIKDYMPAGGDFPEFGGVRGTNHRGLLPTGETLQFILGGNNIRERLSVQEIFFSSKLLSKGVLSLESVKEGEPKMSGRIIFSQEYVELLTMGKIYAPVFSQDFPAKKIDTVMTWEDLVLRPATQTQITDIKVWIEHHQALAKDSIIARKLKQGYRVLFYGPPGTGKTLTASLLGKQFKKDVYRIDLSQVVSKFIGETEKNLEKIFAKAENKDWMLFFDEADSLFGKRSGISSSHDKYANQEVSYLLQRIEDFQGLIMLASNFKNNIDQAFLRRFNSIIHFPMPDATERLSIWQKNVPESIPLLPDVNLKLYADKYEFSGSAITNIMQYACLHAISRKAGVGNDEINNGIRRELLKEDRLQ